MKKLMKEETKLRVGLSFSTEMIQKSSITSGVIDIAGSRAPSSLQFDFGFPLCGKPAPTGSKTASTSLESHCTFFRYYTIFS